MTSDGLIQTLFAMTSSSFQYRFFQLSGIIFYYVYLKKKKIFTAEQDIIINEFYFQLIEKRISNWNKIN